MSSFNMQRIRRQAHREAWYGDVWSPFRQMRVNEWDAEAEADSEGGRRPPYGAPLSSNSFESRERAARARFLGRFRPAKFSSAQLTTSDSKNHLKHKNFTVANQFQSLIMASWVRVLLLLTPVGFAVHYTSVNNTTDFLVNFFAVLPLTDMFGQSLVELKMYAGDPRIELAAYVLCGNINQTFTSAFLLKSGQTDVLKSSLLGGMLLRILLVTSIALVTNDRRHRFQKKSVAISLSKHLGIAVTGLIIPTALSMVTAPDNTDVNQQSRGVSVVLLLLYGLYLYSEWRTYSLFGLQGSTDLQKKGEGYIREKGQVFVALAVAGGIAAGFGRPHPDRPATPVVVPRDEIFNADAMNETDEKGPREHQLHFIISLITLAIVGCLLALHIFFMSDSVNGIVEETGISREFIGLILFPILGVDSTLLHLDNRYDSEEVTQATLGLGLQTILFMTPVLVLVSWAAGIGDMNLLFNAFEVTVLFPAVLVVQASVEENENGWLSGALLFSTYVIIAIAAWFQK